MLRCGWRWMCLAMPLLYNHQVQNRMRRVGIVCLHALRFACERIEGSGLGGGDGGGNRGERLVSTCATGNSSEHEPSHRKLARQREISVPHMVSFLST